MSSAVPKLALALLLATGATSSVATEPGESHPAAAGALPGIMPAMSEQGEVLVMPRLTAATGETLVDGTRVEVATEKGFLVYRVWHRGRVHTAHNPIAGPRRWVAFDPGQGRFRALSSSLLVRMDDYDALDAVVDRAGALGGKAYPRLGWALLRLPRSTNPADAARRLTADPLVLSVELLLRDRGPLVPTPLRWTMPCDSPTPIRRTAWASSASLPLSSAAPLSTSRTMTVPA